MVHGIADPRVLSLQSHGPGSSLVAHTYEVATLVSAQWEKVAAVCHDVLKAHPKWQAYSRSKFSLESPFPHAEAGALLAYFVLNDHPVAERLAALHTCAAHHSNLGSLDAIELDNSITRLLESEDCHLFAEALLTQWAGVPAGKVKEAFTALRGLRGPVPKMRELLGLEEDLQLKCALMARDFLGRMVLSDHASAKAQSEGSTFAVSLPEGKPFNVRKGVRKYENRTPVDALRSLLLQQVCSLDSSKKYFLIDAPTGLGKSNAVISLAEKICLEQKMEKIIYSAALTSIGDQTFQDYFGSEGKNAQIWNYKRRKFASTWSSEEANPLNQETIELAKLESPFGSCFNVTTFNQILLALLHPHKHYALRSLDLKNCVIIFDEFQAIPAEVMSALLDLLDYRDDIKAIFMSATPTNLHLWGSRGVAVVSQETKNRIKNSPSVASRRAYAKAGCMDVGAVTSLIQGHAPDAGDMLVMLNLIGKGTLPVALALGLPANPWERATKITRNSQGAQLYWLDGTVPPSLRAEIIASLKRGRGTGHILLCSPVIKAGVDLDFDIGWEDFYSFHDSIQTAGRVGRNGGGRNKILHPFSFVTESGISRYILQKHQVDTLQDKYKFPHWGDLSTLITQRMVTKFELEEARFSQLKDGIPLDEAAFYTMASEIDEKLPQLPLPFLPKTLKPTRAAIGLNIDCWAKLANLYETDYSSDIILLPPSLDVPATIQLCKNDKRECIKIEQMYCIRAPQQLKDALITEGTYPTREYINNTEVWASLGNQI